MCRGCDFNMHAFVGEMQWEEGTGPFLPGGDEWDRIAGGLTKAQGAGAVDPLERLAGLCGLLVGLCHPTACCRSAEECQQNGRQGHVTHPVANAVLK